MENNKQLEDLIFTKELLERQERLRLPQGYTMTTQDWKCYMMRTYNLTGLDLELGNLQKYSHSID